MHIIEKGKAGNSWNIEGLRAVDNPAVQYRIRCSACHSLLGFSIDDISTQTRKDSFTSLMRNTTTYEANGTFYLSCPCCGQRFEIGNTSKHCDSREQRDAIKDSDLLLQFLYECAMRSRQYFCADEFPENTPVREFTEEEIKSLRKIKQQYQKAEKQNKRAEKKAERERKKHPWSDDRGDSPDDSSSADITIDVTFH